MVSQIGIDSGVVLGRIDPDRISVGLGPPNAGGAPRRPHQMEEGTSAKRRLTELLVLGNQFLSPSPRPPNLPSVSGASLAEHARFRPASSLLSSITRLRARAPCGRAGTCISSANRRGVRP